MLPWQGALLIRCPQSDGERREGGELPTTDGGHADIDSDAVLWSQASISAEALHSTLLEAQLGVGSFALRKSASADHTAVLTVLKSVAEQPSEHRLQMLKGPRARCVLIGTHADRLPVFRSLDECIKELKGPRGRALLGVQLGLCVGFNSFTYSKVTPYSTRTARGPDSRPRPPPRYVHVPDFGTHTPAGGHDSVGADNEAYRKLIRATLEPEYDGPVAGGGRK